jgi:hypothetical protein
VKKQKRNGMEAREQPQPQPLNRGRAVQEVLQDWAHLNGYPGVADLSRRRDAFGRSKYGQTLMDEDGRDTFKDCEDEIGDFLAYMMKHKMQVASAEARGDAHAAAADPRMDLLFSFVDAATTLMLADPSSYPITPLPPAPTPMDMTEDSGDDDDDDDDDDDNDYTVVGHSDGEDEEDTHTGIGPYR